MSWYTIVSSGGAMVTAYPTDWPRGPWRSEDEAHEALDRWVRRRGVDDQWGTIASAHNIRIVGPFRTRDIARRVDISDYSRYLMSRAVEQKSPGYPGEPPAGMDWSDWYALNNID